MVLPDRWLVEPFNDGADASERLALQLGFCDSPACDMAGATPAPGGFCDDWTGVPLASKRPVEDCEVLGLRESRAYVRVDLVGQLHDPDGSVLYCDDGYCDDDVWGYPDVGLHPALGSASKALQEELRNKRAGGVQTDIYLENATYLQRYDDVA